MILHLAQIFKVRKKTLMGWSCYLEPEAGTGGVRRGAAGRGRGARAALLAPQGEPGTHVFLFAPLSPILLFSFK